MNIFMPINVKKLYLFFQFIICVQLIHAQVSKTVSIVAGGLATALTPDELENVTDLKVTGAMNDDDFYSIRFYMPKIENLDLSAVSTQSVPILAFCNNITQKGVETLKTVILPEGLVSIGYAAFANCINLRSINIPNTVNTLKSAFMGCINLTTVNLPESLYVITESTFEGCVSLTNINIPSKIFWIDKKAFKNCWSLSSVTIPAEVYKVDEEAFNRCLSLTSVEFIEGKSSWYSNTVILANAFLDCFNLSSVSLSSKVDVIGEWAFANCNKLTSINLPDGMRYIDQQAFNSCTSLTSVNIPYGIKTIYDGVFSFCSNLSSVTIPSTVESIYNSAFAKCSKLTSVTIPSSVTYIEGYAFSDCIGLTSIKALGTIPVNLIYNPNVFQNVDKNSCKLYVPDGSESLYQLSNQWKDFKNIISTKISNHLPTAIAGTDLIAEPGIIELNGIQSFDPDGDPLTYRWIAPDDFPVDRFWPNGRNLAFYVDLNSTIYKYTFSLVVNDGTTDSPPDQVTVTVKLPPVANAGPDQIVYEGDTVTLDASQSVANGDTLIYNWLDSYPRLSSFSAQKPTFIAPNVSQQLDINYTLEVNNGRLTSFLRDQVTITVRKKNLPIANAGNDQIVGAGIVCTLNGSRSSDPNGSSLTYKWTAPEGITMSSVSDQKPTFTAPIVTADTSFIFSLIVNNGIFDSPADYVKITVNRRNNPPIADVGVDLKVDRFGFIALDGSKSNDPDGDLLTYIWTAPPGFLISSEFLQKPLLWPPVVYDTTNYIISLIVNDGKVDSQVDKAVITVLPTFQTINITPGSLFNTLNTNKPLTQIKFLKLKGKMDARDFKTLRNEMPFLTDLDLSEVEIVEYKGGEGTNWSWMGETTYLANSIPLYSFYNKTSLINIFLPNSITNIDDEAFINCDNLTSINIPSGVVSIGHKAFGYCKELTSVIIPATTITIDSIAFEGASGIVFVDENNPNYSSVGGVLFNKTITTILHIPSNYKNYSIPSSVTVIGEGAFGGCDSLTSLHIPSSVTNIAEGAFNGCISLTTLQIPSSVTYIGNFAFYNCKNLTSVIIPFSVTYIGNAAFLECVNLTSVKIPASVISTGEGIFGNCINLGLINSQHEKPIDFSSYSGVFYNVDKESCKLYVPSGSKEAYENANLWQDFKNIIEINFDNHVPIAIAGSDKNVNEGNIVALDGSGSQDIDNNALTFKWTAPEGITLSSSDAQNPTFMAPYVSSDKAFIFSLVVNDGTVNSPPDYVVIIVNHVNHAPVANAGLDKSVNEGETVILDASSSSDPDNDRLFYKWQGPTGISLSNIYAKNPTFKAPQVSHNTSYIFSLVVNDGQIESTVDQVVITVNQVNQPPVANAGYNRYINERTIFTLDASNSYDPDNDSLSYKWTAPPEITLSSTTDEKPTFATPGTNSSKNFTFNLVVNDGKVDSRTDQVVITVKDIDQTSLSTQFVNEGATVTLDGSIFTGINSDLYSYQWTAPVGITLSSETAKKPTFIAPNVTSNTILVFSLVAYDGEVETPEYQVIIYVLKLLGAGTADNPYLISSVAELNWMRVQVNYNNFNFGDKYYKLINDLDFTKEGDWIPIGNFEAPFMGKFNGNDKVIRHIKIGSETNIANNKLSGLFGYISGGTVFNVGVEWEGIFATFASNTYAGGIVASSSYGTIINCFTSGNINNSSSNSESSTGGIAGINTGSIINCYTTCNISSTPILKAISGGIAGENYVSTGTIKNCYAMGSITSFTKEKYAFFNSIAGGIAGVNDRYASIKNSLALNKAIIAINSAGIDGTFANRITQNKATLLTNYASPLVEVLRGTSTANLTKTTDFTGDSNGITMTDSQKPVNMLNAYVAQNKTFNGIPLSNWKVDSTLNNGFPIFGLSPNELPVANAGLDQVVNERDLVLLDGTLSSDPEDSTLTYLWTTPEGITLNSFSSKPIFTAPNISKDTDYVFILIVNDGISNSKADSVKITVLNRNEICQTVQFKTGWNIFSVPSTPNPAEMGVLFQPAISNKSLVKIQDEAGNSMEDWGIFGGWQDNIGSISPTEGYKIKVSKTDSVEICGVPVKYPYAILLNSGWNIMGYPQTKSVDGMVVVQQLIDRGMLLKVQDESGNSVENWGIFGGWQNNIGDFMAGEGYKVKVSAKDTLWIYDNYPKSTTILPELTATIHFQPEFEGNGVDHMNINVVGLPIKILRAGDELAVFDNETCVGAVTIMPQHLKKQLVSIVASASDNQGMPGFTEGSQFTLKLWKSVNNREFILEPEILRGTESFTKHETTVASLEKYATTGLDGIPDLSSSEINCYPNPFSDKITVEIRLAVEAQIQVEVLNQLGQHVKTITSKQLYPGGLHQLEWNGRNANNQAVSPGVYNLKVNVDNSIIHRKILYLK